MPSWFDNDDTRKKPEKEKEPMSRRFLSACLLILGGVIALGIAIELLAHFWGSLLLAAGIATAGWIAFKVIQSRRDRW